MNFNATLFGQMIAFAIFVWFCMKFVWPPIIKALEDRKTRIADGLAAAEKGVHDLELASRRATEILHEGKEQSPCLFDYKASISNSNSFFLFSFSIFISALKFTGSYFC